MIRGPFPRHGGWLSADSVQSLLGKHVRVAHKSCPYLKAKSVSPHVLRHSAAMELLQAGIDCSAIALWLGYESVETTQTYLHAHLALKEAALAKLKPYERGKRTRFQPNDRLLAFLSERPDYAEWNGAAVRAIDDATVTTARHTGPVRHSSAGGIDLPDERRRSASLAR